MLCGPWRKPPFCLYRAMAYPFVHLSHGQHIPHSGRPSSVYSPILLPYNITLVASYGVHVKREECLSKGEKAMPFRLTLTRTSSTIELTYVTLNVMQVAVRRYNQATYIYMTQRLQSTACCRCMWSNVLLLEWLMTSIKSLLTLCRCVVITSGHFVHLETSTIHWRLSSPNIQTHL